jgi:hypothetical protein
MLYRLHLACTSTGKGSSIAETPPVWPATSTPFVCSRSGSDWFHSHASLDSVCSIETCKDRETSNLLGMLLIYSDGSREALGQFRVGLGIERVLENSTIPCMYLRLELSDYPRILSICTKALCAVHSKADERGWSTIPMQGTLEWWFKTGASFFHHRPDVHQTLGL